MGNEWARGEHATWRNHKMQALAINCLIVIKMKEEKKELSYLEMDEGKGPFGFVSMFLFQKLVFLEHF